MRPTEASARSLPSPSFARLPLASLTSKHKCSLSSRSFRLVIDCSLERVEHGNKICSKLAPAWRAKLLIVAPLHSTRLAVTMMQILAFTYHSFGLALEPRELPSDMEQKLCATPSIGSSQYGNDRGEGRRGLVSRLSKRELENYLTGREQVDQPGRL